MIIYLSILFISLVVIFSIVNKEDFMVEPYSPISSNPTDPKRKIFMSVDELMYDYQIPFYS